MTKKRKPYKTYTREFKQEAVRLMDESDKPASEIALELGIRGQYTYFNKSTRIHIDQESTRTVVVRNPTGSGQSTAFQPQDWNSYISTLPKQTTPFQ